MRLRPLTAHLLTAALAVLVCGLSTGCFIVEELDSGMEILQKTGQQQPKAASKSTTAKQGAPAQKSSRALEADWWSKAKSLSTGEVKESMVRCRVGGSTQFMDRTDCLARGGEPQRS